MISKVQLFTQNWQSFHQKSNNSVSCQGYPPDKFVRTTKSVSFQGNDVFVKSAAASQKISFRGTIAPELNARMPEFTTAVMNTPCNPKPFYDVDEFLDIAKQYNCDTGGELPPEFLTLCQGNPKKVLEFLNEFSDLIRKLDFSHAPLKKFNVNPASGEKIECEYKGKGSYGQVFKMTVNDKTYAFKIFHQFVPVIETGIDTPNHSHGAAKEIRTGLNLCGETYNDLAKFYIGNFAPQKGWAIMEYISSAKDYKRTREGKSLLERRPDLEITDNKYNNTINGIRVDYGGIITKDSLDLELFLHHEDNKNKSFYDLLNNPAKRKDIAYRIWDLPQKDRKQAFEALLNYPDPEARKGIASQLRFLPENEAKTERKTLFEALLNHPDPEARKGIASQLDYLPREYKTEAFYSLLNHPDIEARKGIASQLRFLPENEAKTERKTIFDVLLNHPDPEAKKGLASQLDCLPENEIKNAFDVLLKHPDSEVRAGIASKLSALDNIHDRINMFYRLLNHPDPATKAGLDDQLRFLPIDKVKEAFYALLRSYDNENLENLGHKIKFLPNNKDQIQAFNDLLKLLYNPKLFTIETSLNN